MLIDVNPGSVFTSLTRCLAVEEEVDPGHALAAEQAKRLDRKLPTTVRLRGSARRECAIGAVGIDVFRLVGIEPVPARRHDLAELRRKEFASRFLQHRTLDLPHLCTRRSISSFLS